MGVFFLIKVSFVKRRLVFIGKNGRVFIYVVVSGTFV